MEDFPWEEAEKKVTFLLALRDINTKATCGDVTIDGITFYHLTEGC